MRNIKFRGKPTKNNISYFEDWVYGLLVISDDKYYILLDILNNIKRDDYEVYMIEVIPETVGQYTGLKDDNEKEIYEGDIIKCSFYPDFIFEIKFTELCWYMRKIPISEHIKLSEVLYEELEVIGNIYDNTELFEEGDSNV